MMEFTSRPSLLVTILLLLQSPILVTSSCPVSFSGSKNCFYTDRYADNTVKFTLNDDNLGPTYDAAVTFHWGPADYDLGFKTYTTGSEVSLERNYNYAEDGDGEYYVGYTIEFGEGAGDGCEGTKYSRYMFLRFDDVTRDCEFEDFEGSNVPTNLPTYDPTIITSSPTKRITPTPTNNPTITTSSPTKRITSTPTNKPFALEITPPTNNPISSPDLEPPELVIPSCGNGICNLLEYDTTCRQDCTDVVLEADLDNEVSNDTGGDGYSISKDVNGTMFSMSSQRDIILTSLNIFSNVEGLERVEIYTKEGSYNGHEADRNSWTKVYDNYNDLQTSQSTQLDLNNEDGVFIVANSTVSFYVFSVSGVQCHIMENDEVGDNALVVRDNVLDVYQGIEQSAKWEEGAKWTGSLGDVALSFRGAFRYDVVEPSDTVGKGQTFSPTKSITRPPTVTPTITSIVKTISPTSTPSARPISLPTTYTPSARPVSWPTTSTPSARPITSVQSSAPIVVVTPKPSSNNITGLSTDEATTPVQEYIVSSKMVFSTFDLLDQFSEKIWIDVTSETIHTEILATFGIESNVTVVEQTAVLGARQVRMLSKKGFSLRNLLSSPLEIDFETTIRFPSNKDDWDGNEMVASAFNTTDKQRKYIEDLKAEDGSYFQSLENMVLEVDGEVVTLPDSGNDDSDPEGAEKGGGDAGGSDNSLIVIVAAVVGGGILLFFVVIGIYYTRRRKNFKRQEVRSLESIHQEEQTRSEVGLDIESSAASNELDNRCFGTIESKEGAMDDISAMEELDFGDAVQAGMDTDITVGESIQSSQQQKYVYGIGNNQMGDSTVFTGSVTRQTEFNDDHTFEDLYGPNPGISNVGEGSSFHRFTVVAPAGLLGIVLDNPNFDLPVVHAIKETSALHGKVRVDDLLLSVDGVDCRGMSTTNVSKFLSSRSKNPTRTLELVRRG